MLIIADFTKRREVHRSFNSAVLRIAGKISPIVFFSAADHLAAANSLAMRRKKILVMESTGKLLTPARVIAEFMSVVYVSLFSFITKQELVVLSISPYGLIILNLLALALRFKPLVFLHNELESILEFPRSPLRRGLYLDAALRIIEKIPSLNLICLSEAIYISLLDMYPRLPLRACRLPLAELPDDMSSCSAERRPVFGIAGTLKEPVIRQNLEKLIDICVKSNFLGTLLIIGGGGLDRHLLEVLERQSKYVAIKLHLNPDNSLYYSLLRSTDAILFLVGGGGYRLTASAVLSDAMSVGKPIISLDNGYANWLQSKLNFIKVVDSVEKMCQFMHTNMSAPNVEGLDLAGAHASFGDDTCGISQLIHGLLKHSKASAA